MIYRIAVNDLPEHRTQICKYISGVTKSGKPKKKVIWKCPYYARWFAMLSRCYKESELERHPTYEDVFVSDEWLRFSNFKSWMEKQDWENKQLDKDILFPDNLEYSEEKCCFVNQEVNKFILEKTRSKGSPIGTSYIAVKGKFIASVNIGRNGHTEHIGAFDCPNRAHLAWASRKLELAIDIASKQDDDRVAAALITKYTLTFNKAKEACE